MSNVGMEKAIDILVPNYRKGSNWLIPFVFSLHSHSKDININFYIIINTELEYPYFQRLIKMLPNSNFVFNFIVVERIIEAGSGMPQALAHLRAGAKNGVAVFKKFVGMMWAANNISENFICVDAETVNIRSLSGFRNKIDSNHGGGRYFGNRIIESDDPILERINRMSLALLGDEVGEVVRGTSSYGIYTWFFDVPIYNPLTLKKMFAHLEGIHGGLEAFFLKLEWSTFEHTIYLYWRVYSEGASITDYRALGVTSLPERLSYMDRFRISAATGYQSLWHYAEMFVSEGIEAPGSSYPYFLFHLDRMFPR